jgi:hypothetical protein
MMLRLLSSAADAMDLRVLTLGPPLKGICRVDRMQEQPHHGLLMPEVAL